MTYILLNFEILMLCGNLGDRQGAETPRMCATAYLSILALATYGGSCDGRKGSSIRSWMN